MSEESFELQHDNFIRKVFAKVKNIKYLLKNVLPKEYLDKIDMDSIKLSKESLVGNKYINKKLSKFYSDIVIEVNLSGQETKCAILIEHKAQKDKFTLAQMLKYIALLWDEEIKNEVSYLTPIVPILLYHGKISWNMDDNLEMCFDKSMEKSFKRFIPKYDYITYDLNKQADDEFLGDLEYIVAMRIMKHIFVDLLKTLKEVIILIQEYYRDKPLTKEFIDFLDLLISYIESSRDVEPEDIDDLVESVEHYELKEVFMTLGKKMELRGKKEGLEEGRKEGRKEGKKEGRKEGKKEGRKEGMKKTKYEIAKKMIDENFVIDTVAKITGLSEEELKDLVQE